MKTLKLFFVLFLSAFATTSHASFAEPVFTVEGTLGSYSISMPGMPSLTADLDPAVPGINGTVKIYKDYLDESVFYILGLSIQENYHNVDYSLPDEGLSATKTFINSGISVGGQEGQSYDPVSHVLTWSKQLSVYGVDDGGAFCTGSVKICASLYPSKFVSGTLDVVLTFDPTLTSFTGFADFTKTLSSGAVVSGHWDFYSTNYAVPVPAAGWLLGSGLIGLAGVARRRRSD